MHGMCIHTQKEAETHREKDRNRERPREQHRDRDREKQIGTTKHGDYSLLSGPVEGHLLSNKGERGLQCPPAIGP